MAIKKPLNCIHVHALAINIALEFKLRAIQWPLNKSQWPSNGYPLAKWSLGISCKLCVQTQAKNGDIDSQEGLIEDQRRSERLRYGAGTFIGH